jgi:uncharacterized membrane protein YfcA
MFLALFVITLAIITIFAGIYGYRREGSGRRSRGGWYGLGVFALLFAGLWLAGNAGNEQLAYGFGIALALALPAVLVVGAAAAIGSAIRRHESKDLSQ